MREMLEFLIGWCYIASRKSEINALLSEYAEYFNI